MRRNGRVEMLEVESGRALARTRELGIATTQTDAAQLLQGNQWGAYIHEVNRSCDGIRQSSLKEVELGIAICCLDVERRKLVSAGGSTSSRVAESRRW